MGRPVLRTKLCDILGIEYPILSAGMGPSLVGEKTGATVELVVAVSEAGGLGVLGAAGFTVDEMRDAIREIRKQTDRPFGVDLILPSQTVTAGDRVSSSGVRSVAITSASRGEGKTLCAASLAVQSAVRGLRTLLIDGYLRARGVERWFELRPESPGLIDLLGREGDLRSPISSMVQPVEASRGVYVDILSAERNCV